MNQTLLFFLHQFRTQVTESHAAKAGSHSWTKQSGANATKSKTLDAKRISHLHYNYAPWGFSKGEEKLQSHKDMSDSLLQYNISHDSFIKTINYSPRHSAQNLHTSEVTSRVMYNYLIRRTNTGNVQRGFGKNEGEWTG